MERNQWESAAEAILFALGEPVEETRLAQAMGCPREAAARACQSLAQGYEAEQAGVRLVRLEESWQLVSAPQWGETIRGLLSRRKPDKLSPAALETLAVVAYFQPVTRVVIDQVRGVDSAHSLALLLGPGAGGALRQLGRAGPPHPLPDDPGVSAELWPVLPGGAARRCRSPA